MNKKKQQEQGTFINQKICQTRHNYLRFHFSLETQEIFHINSIICYLRIIRKYNIAVK